jgi:uncharacterized protein
LKMFDERNGGFGSAPKFPHPSMVDLLIDQYARNDASHRRTDEAVRPHMDRGGTSEDARRSENYSERLANVFAMTLERMARGGVYDQLAGGFHRYSVDERWIVPHFEKMAYDNSELLKNYVHAYLATGNEFFASVARDIIRWMDEGLSDHQHGGFYASQDADYSMDDDGDYFTWTVGEAKAVLTEEETQVACLHYDINEIGEMHHNPAKNVLYQRASIEEIATRLKLSNGPVQELLQSAKQKMYAARLKRPTPYVDKTVYVSWNALCISAYLKAARGLGLDDARRFALRSLDRVLSNAWHPEAGLRHVVAYSDSRGDGRASNGFLDDYAFTAIACLDAYEATADLTYFRTARQITDQMVRRFYDTAGGGFFDSEPNGESLGVLNTARKPFQDSPTPAGNPMAAIALLRMHGYTDQAEYRDKAQQTLELLGGAAGQYGLFAANYGIAAALFFTPHAQIVVVGDGSTADELYGEAISSASLGSAVLKLKFNQAVAANLPPSLGATIPLLPGLKQGKTLAVVCFGFRCSPPVCSVEELREQLTAERPAA